LIDSGLEINETLIVHGSYNLQQVIELTNYLIDLPSPPDGLVVVSDRLAIGAMSAMRARGVKVPNDLAIVSFNDEPICTIVTPTLTSVSQPTMEMGRMAMSLLINQIEKEGSPSEVKVFKTELKVRESSRRSRGK
jgi:DNA-binding LacI/PurR family transcriptional regulator